MKQRFKFLTIGLIAFLTIHANAQTNVLKKCWERQVKPLRNNFLTFSFSEKRNELEHSFQPWEESNYNSTGIVWCNADKFLMSDSLSFGEEKYNSKTQFNESTLLFMDYGQIELSPITHGMFQNQRFKTIRYSPIGIITYFFEQNVTADNESNSELVVYKAEINKVIVKLYIRKSDNLLDKITTLSDCKLPYNWTT